MTCVLLYRGPVDIQWHTVTIGRRNTRDLVVSGSWGNRLLSSLTNDY
jgi:hypothetical protein